jgi:hypothetical protein
MDLIFFKSKEHANHYIIHKANSGTNPEPLLAKLTHTGEYADSGHPHVELEMGFVFRTDAPEKFLVFFGGADCHAPHRERILQPQHRPLVV